MELRMAKEVREDENQLDLHGSARMESADPSVGRPPERSTDLESVGPLTPTRPGRTSRKADRQEFFLPVSGFVWLFPEEVVIVNHPAFQRLGRIYQLGQSYVVFRGATHRRIEHVIGALHVVQRMIAAVETNSDKISGNSHGAPPLSEAESRFGRLGTLLHDIGHLAAGHTVEDELELVSKHDGDRRLGMIFDGEAWRDRDGQPLGKLIDKTYDQFVPTELKNAGITPSEIVRLLIRKPPQPPDGHARSADVLKESSSIRLQICRDMIGNTICADLLDYIHRDWYHVGKARPFDERLLQYMELRNGVSTHTGLPKPTDRFVISLGSRPKIRTDAVSNILDLLEWRYSLAETVLFHRTKLAATAMLDRALYELWGGIDNEDEIVQFLLPLSDEEMLSRCRERAESMLKPSKADKTTRERMATAASLLGSLERRELFSHLSTRFAGDLPGDRIVAIKATYARDPRNPKGPAKNRNSVLRTLEQDFGLPHGSLGMYCPSGMNKKIAEVQISVGDEIERFCDYEEKHDRPLAGGHLDAQLRRFDRLWRVHFFVDRRVKETLGDRLFLLQQAIDKLALGNLVDDESGERVAMSLAKWLTQTDGSPWRGFNTSTTPLSAKSGASTAPEEYPTGAPSVRAFLYK
jgi:HD superfamily phosphohydrolase